MRAFSSSFSLRGGRSDSHALKHPPSAHTQTPTTTTTTAPAAPRLVKSRSIALFSSKAPKQPLETSPPAILHRTSGGRRPDLTPDSSASSDGSSSLRTPDDEGLMPFPANTSKSAIDEKKKWHAWLSSTWRKSADRVSEHASEYGDRIPPHAPHRLTTKPAAAAASQPGPSARRSVSDTSEDDSASESGDDYDEDEALTPVSKPGIPTRAQVLQAQANVRTLLKNALCPMASPPPLVDGASHSFPRSSAQLHRGPPRTPSLQELLHTRRSLQRLDRRALTTAEARSIAPFANKPQIKASSRSGFGNERTKSFDYESITDVSMRVGRFSRGVRRWATRPCFEQRFQVWLPDPSGNITSTNVTGVERPVAICDLEYSEWTESLGGLGMDNNAFDSALFHSFNTLPRKHSPPRNSPRRANFTINPSPLRVERAPPAEPVVSAISSSTSSTHESKLSEPVLKADANVSATSDTSRCADAKALPVSPASGSATSKEDDGKEDDDNVPLEYVGYAIQAKKRKEEKERFLAAERQKRGRMNAESQAAEAKKRAEADRKRLEEDARWAEEERVRGEEARKQAELDRIGFEEKQKAIYNEEVAAARKRRESARLGMENYDNIREMNKVDRRASYARPAYDVSPQPSAGGKRTSSHFPAPDSPVDRAGSAPSKLPSVAESKEDNSSVRRSVVVTPSGSRPSLNAEPARPSASRRISMKLPEPFEPVERPASVISTASNAHRESLIRSQSAPNTLLPGMMPYAMMPMQAIPPVPPMPVWNMNMNMNMGMGMNMPPAMPPLMMPNAAFMMPNYSPHSGTPSPVSGSPGSGNPLMMKMKTDSRSRSGSRSRDQREHHHEGERSSPGPSNSRRQSGVPQQHSVPSHNVSGSGHAKEGASSTRSRHSIFAQQQQAAAAAMSMSKSGSYVSLNMSNPHLASVASVASGTQGRSPAKRMSSLPHSSSQPAMPSLPREHSRRSVYGNVGGGQHPSTSGTAAPQAKRRTTMM